MRRVRTRIRSRGIVVSRPCVHRGPGRPLTSIVPGPPPRWVRTGRNPPPAAAEKRGRNPGRAEPPARVRSRSPPATGRASSRPAVSSAAPGAGRPRPEAQLLRRYSHSMPVCRTDRIPHNACRSGIRGRPSIGFGPGSGSNGSMNGHSSSETDHGRDSPFPATGPRTKCPLRRHTCGRRGAWLEAARETVTSLPNASPSKRHRCPRLGDADDRGAHAGGGLCEPGVPEDGEPGPGARPGVRGRLATRCSRRGARSSFRSVRSSGTTGGTALITADRLRVRLQSEPSRSPAVPWRCGCRRPEPACSSARRQSRPASQAE